MQDDTEILLIDQAGKLIRISPDEIRTMGRQAQGVRLIRLDKGQMLSSVVGFKELHPRDDFEAQEGDFEMIREEAPQALIPEDDSEE